MTAEKTSIYSALSRQLSLVKNDYCFRTGKEAKMRFWIGWSTFDEMKQESSMMYFFDDSTYGVGLGKIQFQGATGEMVYGLDGFIIQLLN